MEAQQSQVNFEVSLLGPPFDVVVVRDQQRIFVSIDNGPQRQSSAIALLRIWRAWIGLISGGCVDRKGALSDCPSVGRWISS
jgi:hypothetical protein